MALLHDAVDSKKLDVRMIERNIARGVVTAEDYDKSLKKLPDDEANAEWVSIDSLAHEADESQMNGKANHHSH